ncbi:MAG: hypothetical protein FJY67_00505 [Calditrichaeota bacterium]|nr:hypothetical protein [Calditrichota bacterium]
MPDPELTGVEVIGLAVAQEIQARKLYRLLALKVQNPLAKGKFLALAREEESHREMLYRLLAASTGEAKPRLPKKALRSYAPIPVNLPLPEILLYAIEKERQAAKFYRDAAGRSSDPSGQRLLYYLAQFEEGHERTLRAEYEAVAEFPGWFEFNGADILLVGP